MAEPRRFRRRPTAVQAMQYDGTMDTQRTIVNWANGKVSGWFDGIYVLRVVTLHGEVTCKPGDWVVRSVTRGDFWPVDEQTFRDTYVDEDAAVSQPGEQS